MLTYLYTMIHKYVRRVYYKDEHGGEHVITIPHSRTYGGISSWEEKARNPDVRQP
jgi:hypothetical protein